MENKHQPSTDNSAFYSTECVKLASTPHDNKPDYGHGALVRSHWNHHGVKVLVNLIMQKGIQWLFLRHYTLILQMSAICESPFRVPGWWFTRRQTVI